MLITGKTIYVLGAGSSHHTGAPLLRDFLLTARLLRESKKELKYKDEFKRIFDWIDSLRGASYYVELDLDNLEHIFSLAEMLKQLGSKEGEEHFSDLRYVVMETLDRCQIQWKEKRLQPDSLYYNFIETLGDLNKKRRDRIVLASGTFERDVIVTLNYDVMLDYAMRFRGVHFDYCLTSGMAGDNFKVLKLHGSTNWAFCRNCKNHFQIISPTPLAPGFSVDPFLEDGGQMFFEMVTHVMLNTPCDQCKEKGTLEPVVIPPTWSKAVGGTPLAKVWETAVNEIKKAFQIIVIGYSLPPTDTFFQYLLTLGLSTNANLHRVIVINNDNSAEFKQRYEKVFARSLSDRGRLIFLGETFQEFIRADMYVMGGQIGVPS